MNKYCVCFFLVLALSTANAKGLGGFLEKVEKITSKVSDYTDKVAQTVTIASSLVDGLISDYKIVNEDVKKLGESIKDQYNSLAQNFQKIINVSKKFAGNAYTDGETLYKNLKKQLDVIIASAENDISTAGKTAKNVIGQLGSDVTILYKDGKLIAKNTTENVEVTESLKELKQKNLDKLAKAIDSVNASLEDAIQLVQSAKEALEKYKAIAEDYTDEAKDKANKIIAELKEFTTAAEKSLKEFVKKEKKSLETILKKANDLAKSSKSLADQILQVSTKVVDKVANNTNKVSTGIKDISNIWKNKPTSGTDYSSNGEVSKKTSEIVNEAKGEINKATESVSEVAAAINSATETVQSALDEVKNQVTNFEYVVTANKLNVRSGPSKSYKVVGLIKKGDAVKVSSFKNNFASIGSGKWVAIPYIKVKTDDAKSTVSQSKKNVVSALESIQSILEMLKK